MHKGGASITVGERYSRYGGRIARSSPNPKSLSPFPSCGRQLAVSGNALYTHQQRNELFLMTLSQLIWVHISVKYPVKSWP